MTVKTGGFLLAGAANALANTSRALYQHRQDPDSLSYLGNERNKCSFGCHTYSEPIRQRSMLIRSRGLLSFNANSCFITGARLSSIDVTFMIQIILEMMHEASLLCLCQGKAKCTNPLPQTTQDTSSHICFLLLSISSSSLLPSSA